MTSLYDYQPPTPLPSWRIKLGAYLRLMRADRPIGWLLLLWPTYWSLWLAAEGIPPWPLLLIFTLGVFLTRSAGCVINDYADRWLDPTVERTQKRPLATGEISGSQALWLFAGLMLIAFGLVLLTNRLTVYMSIAAVALASIYPYLKRYTYLPQVWLGLAFGWGIPMAYTAVHNQLPPPPIWLLFCANVLWTTAYDTWYAMVDRDDDRRAGAKSTAILLGEADLAGLGILYGLFFTAMAMLATHMQLGRWYFAGLGVALLIVIWQFWRGRDRSKAGCFAAFLANHWVGMIIFLGLGLDFALRV